ncbi:MAG: hypothetical protein QM813_27225 [Verrucomicrobiota bacterium]
MKKLLITIALAAAFACYSNAAEGEAKNENKDAAAKKKSEKPEKSAPGAEQKALRKELTEKYDANKNGRLDKEEKSKMTPEDQEKWNSVASTAKAKSPEKEKKDAGAKTKPEKTEKKP